MSIEDIRNKLHAKFYDKDRTEMVLHEKSQAFSGKYGHTGLALINKWFPDVAIVEIWYNDTILFTMNLMDLVYVVENKPVGPDQVVVRRSTAAKYDAMVAKLMAECGQLREQLLDAREQILNAKAH